jgi:hypothetical protein
MQTIEIRQNKKTLIPMLAVLTAALIGMTYYIYFSGTYDNNNTMKIVYVFLTASLLYSIYIPTKKFVKNEPVLTFRKSEIEINEKGKPVSFLWLQIIDWKIEKEEDSSTYYLTIETADTKKRINISWLDKGPSEIEELLRTYKTR